jgi:hypothetical protein
VATIGAAILGVERPQEASAATQVFAGGTSTTPSAEGDNALGGPGLAGNTTGASFTNPGAIGVYGQSTSSGIGVLGANASDPNAAVEGHNLGAGGGFFGTTETLGFAAVDGRNFGGGLGIYGTTTSGTAAAVEGDNLGSGPALLGHNTGGGAAVVGNNSTGVGGPPAISGANAGPGGPGVVGYGTGTSSIGTGGVSDTGYGVYGSASGNGTGVLGFSASGTAIWGAANGSGYSGQFTGGAGVIIYGALTIAGGPKSAAVKGADGTLRRLYSLECPESWFEDFGSGQLSGGSATVQLEPGFAGVVKTEQYRVFPVANGDCKGLYISSKTSTSFTVHELQGGTSNVAFDYRVVAKRKDIEGARLEHIEEPALPTLPKLPEPPPTPPVSPVPTPPGSRG